MIADMADALALLGTGTYAVKRFGPSVYVDGRLQAQAGANLSVQGTLVPLTALELQRLPEGLRDREAWNLFSVTELVSAQSGAEPDVVTLDGSPYRVEKVERWGEAGNFFKSTLVRP